MDRRYSMEDFDIIRVVGKGYMGKVMVVKEKATNQIFAIKTIHKQAILQRKEVNHTRSERDILADLVTIHNDCNLVECPFLIHLHAAFQDRANIYYLMDFHSGGDLAGLLSQLIRLPENWVRFYSAQILVGILELHKRGIVYRDLKPENVLLSQEGNLVLTDFGLSKLVRDQVTRTFCGTPEYLAPEVVLRKPYGKMVDWWSFGALLYEMIVGMTPFWSDDPATMYALIVGNKTVAMPPSLGREAKDLLMKLLTRDPAKRISGEEMVRHPFYAGIDWDKVIRMEYIPPYVPPLAARSEFWTFDALFTNMPPIITPEDSNYLPDGSMMEKAFHGFSFRQRPGHH